MRVLLLALVPLVLGNPIQEQVDVGSAEDHELLKQMVLDLFSDREGREIEIDEDAEGTDVATNLDSAEPSEEKPSGALVQETDPIEIARFNNYMDAIYRRMNAALRAKLMDPMILNLDSKNNSNKKKKKNHNVSKRDADMDEEEVDRMGELEEDEDEGEAVEEGEEGEGRKMQKRKKKNGGKKKEGGKKKNKADKKKGEKKKSGGKKGKGKGKGAHKGKKSEHKEKKGKGKKEGNKKEDESLMRSRRNKHSKNDKHHKKEDKMNKGHHGKKGKKGKDDSDMESGKSMGSLAGIATLRRADDVVVLNADSYKTVKSDFTIGPLQLEVSKTFGKGKSRSVKTAKAVTDELKGKMVLKVKPDGSAHVKSVFFHKPENVEVRGSLGAKERSDAYLRGSVGKVRPMAAQRILKMARYVLKSPSTVQKS